MILVVGATGDLGGLITRKLLKQRKSVRILVRPGSNYRLLVQGGAEPISGDIKDRSSLDRVLEGVETVITTANAIRRGEDDNFDTVDRAGNRNLIDAAKQAGVKQFIFVSVLGADPNHPLSFFSSKGQTEAYLRDSGIPYTILQPGMYIEMWGGMIIALPVHMHLSVSLVGEGAGQVAFVSQEDVANYAVAMVGHPAAINQTIPVVGPKTYTWREIVNAASQILGQKLPVASIQPGQALPGLPPEASLVLAWMEMMELHNIDMRNTSDLFGVLPTRIEDAVRQILM